MAHTFTASGAAPEVLLHVEHGASVSIAMAFIDVHLCLIPFHQPTLALWRRNSLRVRWVLCSPLPFVLRTSPGEGPSPSVLVLVSVAVPRADSSAPSDSSSGPWRFGGGSLPSCPLACTSRRKAPVFPREDANKTREVAHWQRSHPLSAAPQTEPGGEAGCPRHSSTGPPGAPRVEPPAVVLTGAVGLAGI